MLKKDCSCKQHKKDDEQLRKEKLNPIVVAFSNGIDKEGKLEVLTSKQKHDNELPIHSFRDRPTIRCGAWKRVTKDAFASSLRF